MIISFLDMHVILLRKMEIIELIENRKNNAYRKVNEEMILLYLDVGKYLFELQQNSKYGDKITTKASEFMKNNYPNIKGFTKRNIERMVQFYKIYKDDEIATPLVTQLSWTNNLLIISGSKSQGERHFYLKLAVKYIPFTKFNKTCYETIGNCLYAIYNSNSFDDSIRKTLIMGGDTDTNACIVGSVSEAIYGMNKKQQLQAKNGLPEEFKKILKMVYK